MSEPNGAPFRDVRVLELGQYVSIPYCAELLAHGGAEVVKIEPIRGDETRFNSPIVPGEGRQYIIKARGKRGIPLDLGRAEGVAVARRLALASDVVLSNMRPGGLERLGLDYASISGEHQRVIYGEISGFGESPERGERASIDIVAQAASGLMIATRGAASTAGVPEAFLTDYMSGTMLAFGIAAALRERDRSGRGQLVETTLMQAALGLMHGTANLFDAVDVPRRVIAEAVAEGSLPRAEGVAQRSSMQPRPFFYNTFETADATIAIGAPGHLGGSLLRIAGIEDPRGSAEWLETDDARPLVRALTKTVGEALQDRRSDELLDELHAAGIPAERLVMLDEVMTSQEAQDAGWVYVADHPAVGPMTMPTAPLRFSESRYEAASTSPAYGADVAELLGAAGYSGEDIEELIASGVTATTLPSER